jgi:hypothetical protein
MNNSSEKRQLMDTETARAFAIDRFEQLHPRHSRPEWFNRCSVLQMTKDSRGRFVVSITLTRLGERSGFVVFSAAIDRATGETEVLVNEDLAGIKGNTLEGFHGPAPQQ